MFCNGCDSGYHTESCLFCSILQFSQSIFICAVSIYTYKNGFRSVSIYRSKAADCRFRNPSAVRWYSDDSSIIIRKRDIGKILLAVSQINRMDFRT